MKDEKGKIDDSSLLETEKRYLEAEKEGKEKRKHEKKGKPAK